MNDDSNRFSIRTDGAAFLRLVLERHHDRFQQSISFVSPGEPSTSLELLTSSDGLVESAWPDSPPIQACQIEPSVGILGTGMAGTTHWSIAITATANELTWDVACRYKKMPEQLGSKYLEQQQFRPVDANSNADGATIAAALPGDYLVRLTVETAPATKSRIEHQSDGWTIRPTEMPAPPITSRWLYRLTLAPPSSNRR